MLAQTKERWSRTPFFLQRKGDEEEPHPGDKKPGRSRNMKRKNNSRYAGWGIVMSYP